MLTVILRRHSLTIDLTTVAQPARDTLQAALNQVTYPLGRIRVRTGHKVPVTVADLSRYAASIDPETGHAHVHDEAGNEAHLLGAPSTLKIDVRHAALGLYWLPTAQAPAGSIQIDTGALRSSPELAREVLVAELAHAVDYGAMTDGQRAQVVALFDWKGVGSPAKGWFEEEGEQGYWRWRGERWMGLFCSAYAPTLPRPLENSQPWQWTYDASDVKAAKRILK
jgi:hypothetical protein